MTNVCELNVIDKNILDSTYQLQVYVFYEFKRPKKVLKFHVACIENENYIV